MDIELVYLQEDTEDRMKHLQAVARAIQEMHDLMGFIEVEVKGHGQKIDNIVLNVTEMRNNVAEAKTILIDSHARREAIRSSQLSSRRP